MSLGSAQRRKPTRLRGSPEPAGPRHTIQRSLSLERQETPPAMAVIPRQCSVRNANKRSPRQARPHGAGPSLARSYLEGGGVIGTLVPPPAPALPVALPPITGGSVVPLC
jgi:hypothetical protein